ncbi:MAG TPA: MBL fold metallo-hydrolase [Dongiaceae bacterium]|nr:MBL fold metallo-hydrolase [Dongiaceae bacterium]
MAKLTFLGAAGTVTGSKYLVEAAGKRLLLDCGIFQGSPELNQRNFKPLSVDPASINYCVVTHAHLDHVGWLPCLVRDGYRGPIYANPATIDLATISLKDSAHIQEEDAERAQRNPKYKDGDDGHEPLYTTEDVDPVVRQFKPAARTGGFDVSPEFHFEAYDAGHILGSTSLALTITEDGKRTVVVFSGDIGRYAQPILNDPVTPPRADVLLCESTYGDREHEAGDPVQALADVVNRVVKRGGSIVIPAFAIGRTQTFMYFLRQLEDEQRIPRVPVYVDSPMALSATDLYVKYHDDHDPDFTKLENSGDHDPLNVREFHLTRTVEESKGINNIKTPCIIISASGMVTGGRVLHHLAQRLPDARNAVLLAGFQAEGTRGRALQEGAKTLHLFGQAVPVNAEVVTMGQLSAHAGKSELLRWLGGLQSAPKKTWLTHGEPAAAQALQAAIREKYQWDVGVARYLDTVDLG